ncbi:hypothetical protein BH10PSE7_BH10PSE7_15070 [soil metagenome]
MSISKPTLGYSSRTEAVLGLRRKGMTTREIASQIGIEEKTVIALESSSGRSKKRAERPAELNGRTVLFPEDVLDQLLSHAAKRGIHPNTLARRLVETAIDENIIDAILDDAHDLETSDDH